MTEIELPSLGTILKNRREELRFSVQDIAEKTRIRSTYILALEEERFDDFPGDAYLCGFLKTVAKALALDVQPLLEQVRQQTGMPVGGRERRAPAYDLPESAPRGKPRYGKFWLALLLVVGLLLLGAYWQQYWPFSTVIPLGHSQLSPISGEFSLPTSAPVPEVLERTVVSVPATPAVTVDTAVPFVDPTGATLEQRLPAAGGMLRVTALGEVQIKVRIDDLPLKEYALTKDSVLSWRVMKSASLQVDRPDSLQVRLAEQLLDLQGRSELLLRPTQLDPPLER